MLVNMSKLLNHAKENKYIVAAPNVWNDWSTRAAIDAAVEMNSPLILDIDYNSNINIWMSYAKPWVEAAPVPIAINLDHGQSFNEVVNAIHAGLTSVMLDKSRESFENNIKEVKRVTEIAKLCNVSVEAELGFVGDATDSDQENTNFFTDPELVKEYVDCTEVDCLAVSVGTAHGKYKDGIVPKINFDLIKQIEQKINIPLVLHGGSGTSNEDLRRLAKETNISKVNLFTDIHEYVIMKTRDIYADLPLYEIDYYYYKAYKEKLSEFIELFDSTNKAGLVTKDKTNYYRGDVDIR